MELVAPAFGNARMALVPNAAPVAIGRGNPAAFRVKDRRVSRKQVSVALSKGGDAVAVTCIGTNPILAGGSILRTGQMVLLGEGSSFSLRPDGKLTFDVVKSTQSSVPAAMGASSGGGGGGGGGSSQPVLALPVTAAGARRKVTRGSAPSFKPAAAPSAPMQRRRSSRVIGGPGLSRGAEPVANSLSLAQEIELIRSEAVKAVHVDNAAAAAAAAAAAVENAALKMLRDAQKGQKASGGSSGGRARGAIPLGQPTLQQETSTDAVPAPHSLHRLLMASSSPPQPIKLPNQPAFAGGTSSGSAWQGRFDAELRALQRDPVDISQFSASAWQYYDNGLWRAYDPHLCCRLTAHLTTLKAHKASGLEQRPELTFRSLSIKHQTGGGARYVVNVEKMVQSNQFTNFSCPVRVQDVVCNSPAGSAGAPCRGSAFRDVVSFIHRQWQSQPECRARPILSIHENFNAMPGGFLFDKWVEKGTEANYTTVLAFHGSSENAINSITQFGFNSKKARPAHKAKKNALYGEGEYVDVAPDVAPGTTYCADNVILVTELLLDLSPGSKTHTTHIPQRLKHLGGHKWHIVKDPSLILPRAIIRFQQL